MKYKKSIFIFRKDLRLYDNTSLIKALEESEEVIPIFILDPFLIDKKRDRYNSNSVQFMFNSLRELDLELKKKNSRLFLFEGKNEEILSKLDFDCIYENFDFSPYAKKRSERIAKFCDIKNINYIQCKDYNLNNLDEIKRENGDVYKVFTPFWKRALMENISLPRENNFSNYFNGKIEGELGIDYLDKLDIKINDKLILKGGRKEAIDILENISNLNNYNDIRDFPTKNTSLLSAHLRFGTVSIRETYYMMKESLGNEHPLLRQLYWRDFWYYIGYHFPKVFTENFIEKTNNVEWNDNKELLEKWCEGKTGFPIVDAGMRELKETGYMHNRVRMIVASFLTKDLHIHWREGEKHFAKYLIDYDPFQNNGNWQWGASTGCDGQPFFRVFNPWLQQLKFDKDCIYIKKWIPELETQNPKAIHNLNKEFPLTLANYPKPMIDHSVESKIAIERFKKFYN